jgi:hypothetical protein
MFTSAVTRLLRRCSFLAGTPAPPRKKSRHELVSDAHAAYMQAQQRRDSRRRQQRQLATLASSSSLSLSSLSSASSSSSSSVMMAAAEAEAAPFESLCRELRRVEESMGRSLSAPGCASDPTYFY